MKTKTKVSRFVKAAIIIGAMVICGVATFIDRVIINDIERNATIVATVVLALGIIVIISSMKTSLKEVLAAASVTEGLYLIVMYFPYFLDTENLSVLLAIIMYVVSVALIILGTNLHSGYRYNIMRMKWITLLLAIICGAILFSHYATGAPLDDTTPTTRNMINIIAMSGSIAYAACDKSLGFTSHSMMMRVNTRSVETLMMSVKDLYILRTDAQRMMERFNMNGEAVECTGRSSFGVCKIRVERIEDKVTALFNITVSGRQYRSLALQVKFAAKDDKCITLYDAEGRNVRLLVFDEIQPNMNNPCILGREIDLHKYGKLR